MSRRCEKDPENSRSFIMGRLDLLHPAFGGGGSLLRRIGSECAGLARYRVKWR
jgi:hypothetical protein